MTDGAALPARPLRPRRTTCARQGVLDATVTAGHAFGGDLEAVSIPGALVAGPPRRRRRRRRRRHGPWRRRHRHRARHHRGRGGCRRSTPPPPSAAGRSCAPGCPTPTTASGTRALSHHTEDRARLIRTPGVPVAGPGEAPRSPMPPPCSTALGCGSRPWAAARTTTRVLRRLLRLPRRPRPSAYRQLGRSVALTASAQRLSRLLNARRRAHRDDAGPLTARELRERVDGYDDERRRLPPQLRARQGGAARPRHRDRRRCERRRRRSARARLPRAAAPATPLRDPGLDPDEAAALQLAVSLVRLDGLTAATACGRSAAGGRAGDRPATRRRRPARRTRSSATLFGAVAERRVTRGSATAARPARSSPYRLALRPGPLVPARPRPASATPSAGSASTASRARRSVGPPRGLRPPATGEPLARCPTRGSSATATPVVARVAVDAAAGAARPARCSARTPWSRRTTTATSSSSWRSPTSTASARSSSASSTTPRCWRRPSCGPTSWPGWRPCV